MLNVNVIKYSKGHQGALHRDGLHRVGYVVCRARGRVFLSFTQGQAADCGLGLHSLLFRYTFIGKPWSCTLASFELEQVRGSVSRSKEFLYQDDCHHEGNT